MADIISFDVDQVIRNAQIQSETSRDLWNGTVAIRTRGKKYLKPSLFEIEDGKEQYKLRLESAVLKPNKFRSTVNYIQGQIFRKPLMLVYDENMQQKDIDFFDKFKEDVDNKNDDYNVFLKNTLKNGLIDGVGFVMIDTPSFEKQNKQIVVNGTSFPDTLDTQKKLNIRPYWVQIELKNVISVKVDWINSKKEYTEFVYSENIVEDNTTKTRVYKYTRDTIDIYTKDLNGNFILEKHLVNNFGFIPVSLFMCGEPTSDYTAIPTLSDLAELQIAHYNAYSEHQQLMRYDRNPLWLAKALDAVEEEGQKRPLVLGPGAGVSGGEESDLKSVGVDSQSVIQSMADLKDLENAMDEYTTSLTSSQNMTATQVDLISGSSDCQIKNWATNFKDFIEDLLCNTAIIQGINSFDGDNYPRVVVNNEFRRAFDYQTATLLQDMVSQGQLTVETFLSVLKSMSVFEDDFDVDEELKLLEQGSSSGFKEPPKE